MGLRLKLLSQFIFMPHMPPWHMSAPHIPVPQPAGSEDFAAPDLAANVEYCVVR
jgi:hypothetical protein